MKELLLKIKEKFNENKNRNMLILVILILTILSSITLIAYSFYQNRSSNLIIAGVASIDKSDVKIKVYREDKNSSGVGLGTYSLSYYVPNETSYSYTSSKTVCDTGITINKYENRIFYVNATKKGKCEVYFDAIDGYIDDYEVNLFVQQEIGSTDDKNYEQMGQLPLYETGYYYTVNTSKTSCNPSATISIVGRKINVLTSVQTVCNVYVDKNADSTSPTISDDLKVENDILTVTLNDNAMLGSYGLSSSSTTEPEEWFNIPTTPYTLSTSITSDTPYLWVKDAAGNAKVSNEISFGPKGWETILLKNGNGAKTVNEAKTYISGKSTPDFSTSATTNEGMYATEDDYGTSYYFRGAVDNNWVKFGKDSSNKDIYWRIIRINGDGSIRLIYTGTTAPSESTKVVMSGSSTIIGKGAFNSNSNSSEYVGYKYEIGKQHGLANDSTIKTTLENWYQATTLYTDEITLKLVSDSSYCYDRSASTNITGTYGEIDSWSSTPSSIYYYGSYGRIYGNKTGPNLKSCTNNMDKYSVSNNLLSYPVGLITMDEVELAGGTGADNSSYYLYNGLYYWFGSPFYYYIRTSGAHVFCMYSFGRIINNSVNTANGIRPVISISKDVKLSGDGTWNNPYIVAN